jgi:hypothetical protein
MLQAGRGGARWKGGYNEGFFDPVVGISVSLPALDLFVQAWASTAGHLGKFFTAVYPRQTSMYGCTELDATNPSAIWYCSREKEFF